MNELTPERQEKIHAMWDKKVLTPAEASRRVNELLRNPPLDPAEIARLRTVYAAIRAARFVN
jgi:hypothetical protein